MIPPRHAVVLDERARSVQWSVDDPYYCRGGMRRLARLRMAKRRRKPIWRRFPASRNQPGNCIAMPWGYDA